MASWQKHPLTALLLVLVFGGYCIYRAMQYSGAAAGEQTTTAQVYRHDTIKHTNCTYNFTVDGKPYSGGDCPGSIPLGHSDATVYYDSSKPSINSLSEFGAASQRWYLYAAWSICSGCVLFGVVVLGGAYKKSKSGNGGSGAGGERTVPDPDTVDRELRGPADDGKPIDSLDNESDRSANDDRG